MPDYFESGFFVKEPAWHRLGTVLDSAPTCAEALRLAGLDWHVQEQPVYVGTDSGEMLLPVPAGVDASALDLPDGKPQKIDSHKALVRATDKRLLGIVGAKYAPLQNAEAFKLFEPLVDSGELRLETAGSLKGGRRVWILARSGRDIEIVEDDRVSPYVLLAHGHDGGMAVRMQSTPIRVVCWNTLSAAVGSTVEEIDASASECFTISHVGDVLKRTEAARDALMEARRRFEATADTFRAMAGQSVTSAQVQHVGRMLLDTDYAKALALIERLRVNEEREDAQKVAKAIADLEEYVNRPATKRDEEFAQVFEEAPGHRSDAWGLYNAATFWIDHGRKARTDDTRVEYSWLGKGRQQRSQALHTVRQAVGV